jgi:hypothetical protein
MLLHLPSAEAYGRLVTAGGVLTDVAAPGMWVSAWAIGGPTRGSELTYGRAPVGKAVSGLLKPQLPPDPSPLQRRAYEVAMKAYWKKLGVVRRGDGLTTRAWAVRRAGGLAASQVRSAAVLTTDEVDQSLYRASLFFARTPQLPKCLLVVGDLGHVPPPDPRFVSLNLDGARVVLAGWSTDDPAAFRSMAASWRGFLVAEGSQSVELLPRGLDRRDRIVAALEAA